MELDLLILVCLGWQCVCNAVHYLDETLNTNPQIYEQYSWWYAGSCLPTT